MATIKIPEDTRVFEKKIMFFGYDKIGFDYPFDIVSEPNYKIVFVNYDSNFINMDEYDGIIIPSGIFENLPRQEDSLRRCNVSYDHVKLLDFEKKIHNFIKSGKWVVFLVDQMVSSIQRNHLESDDISDTDLAKKILSLFCKWRPVYKGVSATKSSTDEFRNYIESYGVAHTVFMDLCENTVPLVEFCGSYYGFQAYNRIFALPFHTSSKEKVVAQDVATKIVESVIPYVEKNRKDLPLWLDNFTFSTEELLINEKESINIRLSEINKQLEYYQNFKSILASSGTGLEGELIEIFNVFFGFDVKTDDKKLDDFQILVDDKVTISGEIKGVKGDIKRKYISQIDTNREEQGLSESVKGLLIANCNNTIEDMSERINQAIPSNVKSFATKINVTIIRTIELLHLMNFLEEKPIDERRSFFINEVMKYTGHVSIDSQGNVTNFTE